MFDATAADCNAMSGGGGGGTWLPSPLPSAVSSRDRMPWRRPAFALERHHAYEPVETGLKRSQRLRLQDCGPRGCHSEVAVYCVNDLPLLCPGCEMTTGASLSDSDGRAGKSWARVSAIGRIVGPMRRDEKMERQESGAAVGWMGGDRIGWGGVDVAELAPGAPESRGKRSGRPGCPRTKRPAPSGQKKQKKKSWRVGTMRWRRRRRREVAGGHGPTRDTWKVACASKRHKRRRARVGRGAPAGPWPHVILPGWVACTDVEDWPLFSFFFCGFFWANSPFLFSRVGRVWRASSSSAWRVGSGWLQRCRSRCWSG